tara:strand:+ start:43974 stop:45437 length:1464 start_codon:yes stop_codon:yes gene_type:complete
MRFLQDILYKVEITSVIGVTDLRITELNFDSRKVTKESLFIAVKGVNLDGHTFIDQAIKNGAAAIVSEKYPSKIIDGITYIVVKKASKALAVISSNFYDNPSKKIKLVGVTGTNGKTTVSSLLFSLFTGMGKKAALLSTINNRINNEIIESTHTTGDSIQINKLLSRMISQGCEYCFMEVSSHAIHQDRVFFLEFDIMIFTNISHDHLDYHKSFRSYIEVKKKVFDNLNSRATALVNIDDKNGVEMLKDTNAKIQTFSLKSDSEFKCKILENRFDGMLLHINHYDIWTKLIGEFNAYNILAIYATGIILGINKEKILEGISLLDSPEGRFQYVRNKEGTIAVLDYAHTPDALENILTSINKIRTGEERLITLIGCGGDRDKLKRSKMAMIAANLSSKVILTSDNPRSEIPEDIIKDMVLGLDTIQKKRCVEIIDRKQAIKTACAFADSGDIILIAGKGHEKYQEIKGIKYPFDDMLEIKINLNLIKG